jgi:cobalt/nickel transport system permease protein
VKLAGLALFVTAVAITPRERVWAFGLYALVAMGAAARARIPIGFLSARLAGVLPFVLFAFFLPFIGTGERVEVLGIVMSRHGLWGAWNILSKALIGATAGIVVVATTEVPDILRGLSRLRVPAVIVAIAGFMVRYLGLIVDELGRMRMAMTSRGHDPRWLWQARPIATGAGAMFVRSYERGERIHAAMVSRGFEGVVPTLSRSPVGIAQWVGGLSLPVLCAITAIVALVGS